MWVSKKKWELLSKKVADLEEKYQSLQEVIEQHLKQHRNDNVEFRKALQEVSDNFVTCINEIKVEIVKEITRELNHQGKS